MAGKVFVSCGQRSPDEKRIAKKVSELLSDTFKLTPYLAFRVQSLDDIMTITKELRSSDYYLFIDFLRDSECPPFSLFTHQEFALAHHLGFEGMIALQHRALQNENRTPRYGGILGYVLSNPEPFDNEKDLLDKVSRLVREREWKPDYSRNLVVKELRIFGPLIYEDHTGTFRERVWRVRVENRRPDVAAVGTVCILDHVQTVDGDTIGCIDRSYLKWAGQKGYERTILPEDFGDIDLFATHAERHGIFLHSLMDVRPREPILSDDGDYELSFKLFSQGFRLVEFSVKLEFCWTPPSPDEWPLKSTASLVRW